MALHRIVNGEKVDLTPEEEEEQLAEWAANAAKPKAVPPRSVADALAEIDALKAKMAVVETDVATLKTPK